MLRVMIFHKLQSMNRFKELKVNLMKLFFTVSAFFFKDHEIESLAEAPKNKKTILRILFSFCFVAFVRLVLQLVLVGNNNNN